MENYEMNSRRGSTQKVLRQENVEDEPEAVAVKSWQQFLVEYKKMARALQRSQQTQKELLEQATELRNEMVKNALRLQVALRFKNDDDKTIYSLRKEAAKALEAANLAEHKQTSAQKLISDLRDEVRELREEIQNMKTELLTVQQQPQNGKLVRPRTSDKVVADAPARVGPQSPKTGRRQRNTPAQVVSFEKPPKEMFTSANEMLKPELMNDLQPDSSWTPFQEWKIANHIWTPDAPAASEHHDPHFLAATRVGTSPMVSRRALTRAATRQGKPGGLMLTSSNGSLSSRLRTTANF